MFKSSMTTNTMLASRRLLLRRIVGLICLLPLHGIAATLKLTPQQTAGPFYPSEPPLDEDNDLTQVQGHAGKARGQHTELAGRILDRNGDPVRNSRVEIWQCDASGRYHHPQDRDDRRPLDPAFQGFGLTYSDELGRYRFRTIRPVPYPGRTPHVHMAVFPQGHTPFVTQMYVQGEPRNDNDFLFTRIPAEQRQLVLARFTPANAPGLVFTTQFDVVLDVTPG